MGRYGAIKTLSKQQQEELFVRFAKCLASLKNSSEAASFIKDLFSESEAMLLARRLYIAELIDGGFTYAQIHQLLRVGDNTIAKVQLWLQSYGEGFRTVLKRTANKEKPRSEASKSWHNLKKRYPMYFWPQLLLEEILKSANKREIERIRRTIEGLKEKTKLTKDILKILNKK